MRICAHCGSKYEASKKSRKFCSRQCSAYHRIVKHLKRVESEYVGKRLGRVVVLALRGFDQRRRLTILIRCDCGNEVVRDFSNLKTGNVYSCGCAKGAPTRYGAITKAVLGRIKRAASARNLEFSVSPEYLWELFQKQCGLCALSGLPIVIPDKANKPSRSTASLDRINSDLGYIEGNLQWVHKDINIMKNRFPNEYFLRTCRQIAYRHPGMIKHTIQEIDWEQA